MPRKVVVAVDPSPVRCVGGGLPAPQLLLLQRSMNACAAWPEPGPSRSPRAAQPGHAALGHKVALQQG
jgi:hypothetical protein